MTITTLLILAAGVAGLLFYLSRMGVAADMADLATELLAANGKCRRPGGPIIATEYYPLRDTILIDKSVATDTIWIGFDGNASVFSYPRNEAETNMGQQGVIPQGSAYVAKALRLEPEENAIDLNPTIAFGHWLDLRTLGQTTSTRIEVENNNEWRNWPTADVLFSPSRITVAQLNNAAALAPAGVNFNRFDNWDPRVGNAKHFGVEPLPRRAGETDAQYLARSACCPGELASLVLAPKQAFSVIIEADTPPAWSLTTETQYLRTTLEGYYTTDINIATGIPSANEYQRLAAPGALPNVDPCACPPRFKGQNRITTYVARRRNGMVPPSRLNAAPMAFADMAGG